MADARADDAGAEPEDAGAAALARVEALLGSLVDSALASTASRCPYKNRFDQCTAHFGCRNQRKPPVPGDPKLCGGDDKLDYRSAWETE